MKTIVSENEVIIILDRHLRSVLEIFGAENHAYCYRHLKENFSTFILRHNTIKNKGKEATLQWFDSIAYVRRNEDCDANLSKLRTNNEVLAKWV